MKKILINHSIIFGIICLAQLILVSCSHVPPSCAITAPTNNSQIVYGSNVEIIVEANDYEGDVNEVKLFIDGIGTEILTEKPFSYEWQTLNLVLGVHTVVVKVIDSDGNIAEDKIDVEIINNPDLPIVTTLNATMVYQNNVVLNGAFDGYENIAVSEKGFYWSEINPNPGPDDHIELLSDMADFKVVLSDLKPGTRHFFRAFVKSDSFIFRGERVSFTTSDEIINGNAYGSYYDARNEGKIYQTVKIGNQVWMTENLAFLPTINLESYNEPDYFVYAYYGNELAEAKSSRYYKKYGVLYNWYATETACPVGWHIPTISEWQNLFEHLSSEHAECTAIDGTNDWNSVAKYLRKEGEWGNGSEADYYGFSALPAGMWSMESENFYALGSAAYWWGNSDQDEVKSYAISIKVDKSRLYIVSSNSVDPALRSVRCVKD